MHEESDEAAPADTSAAPNNPPPRAEPTLSGEPIFGHGLGRAETEPERRLREQRLARGLPPETDHDRARRGEVPGDHVSRLKTAEDRANRPEPRWLVEHVLPEWGVGQLVGPSYTGKTYVALDLALRVANGLAEWCGGVIAGPADVVYVAMEGAFDLAEREAAWLDAYPGTTGEGLFTLEEEALDLRDKASIELLAADIRLKSVAPALVIIDTQALATPGTDEQSNTDMSEVFARCKVLAKGLKCVVLLVHHTGHKEMERGRGASAQFAACDFSILVSKPDGSTAGTLKVKKVKAYKEHGPYGFEIVEASRSAYARPLVPGAELAAAATRSLGVRAEVFAAIAATGFEGVAKGELARLVGRSNAVVLALVDELEAEGLVEVVKHGRRHLVRAVRP